MPCPINFNFATLQGMLGLAVALAVLFSWLFTLGFALTNVQLISIYDVFSFIWLILIIQFLYVGLFITVHDACHGSVAPNHPRWNLWVGRVFAFLYAGLSFDRLARKHQDHHRFSGTDLDPDFQAEGRNSILFWIARFFSQYITLRQILIMCGVAQFLMHGLHLPEINVFTFWVAPSILSSCQLFYFGTYLPHRVIKNKAFPDHHHARDFSSSYFLSLVSCYHFGVYHHVHHKFPGRPWFELPRKVKG